MSSVVRWLRRLVVILPGLLMTGVAVAGPVGPRLVSMLPSLTEIVCELGACGDIVATDTNVDDARLAKLPRFEIGGAATPGRIAALRPTLVLTGSFDRASIAALRAQGITVLAPGTQTWTEFEDATRAIAGQLGVPERGEAMLRALSARIDAAASQVPASCRGRSVYFEIDPTPYAAGRDSFLGEVLARLGLENIVGPGAGAFPKLDGAWVVQRDPAVVIAYEGRLARMPGRDGWEGMSAFRAGTVCPLDKVDYNHLVRPGPRLGEGALAIARCLGRIDSC